MTTESFTILPNLDFSLALPKPQILFCPRIVLAKKELSTEISE
jgi:hypothetical protein